MDEGKSTKYAMKILSRGKLKKKFITLEKSAYDNVQTEIAILKKLVWQF
jgi:hypothetical protein